MEIQTIAYPRAALIGNPSDGYFGKTIAFTFKNFQADVVLMESENVSLVPTFRDRTEFGSVWELQEDIGQFGYYGGIRLMKATIKVFLDFCKEQGLELHHRNFTLKYESDIPARLGMAGSSAIITACLRALMQFYKVDIPKPLLANVVLTAEKDELDIQAGLQDRVAQVYETPIFMDFNREAFRRQGYGNYLPLPVNLLPPLYIAFRRDLEEGSETVHNGLRERFDRGEEEVVKAMHEFGNLTMRFMNAMRQGDLKEMNVLIDANLDLRASLYDIGEENRKMIAMARETGVSAKFTGSGGAIIGICRDDQMLELLKQVMGEINVQVIRPII